MFNPIVQNQAKDYLWDRGIVTDFSDPLAGVSRGKRTDEIKTCVESNNYASDGEQDDPNFIDDVEPDMVPPPQTRSANRATTIGKDRAIAQATQEDEWLYTDV